MTLADLQHSETIDNGVVAVRASYCQKTVVSQCFEEFHVTALLHPRFRVAASQRKRQPKRLKKEHMPSLMISKDILETVSSLCHCSYLCGACQVFCRLDIGDIGRCLCVCKKWNEIKNSNILWKNLCYQYFGPNDTSETDKNNWFLLFKER